MIEKLPSLEDDGLAAPEVGAWAEYKYRLVCEYKGKPYVTNDDSKEKRNLGELWEERSNGKGLFLMAEKRNAQGSDVYKQLVDKISN